MYPNKKSIPLIKIPAADRTTSDRSPLSLGARLVTQLVLPVQDYWQFDPWWIPKLRNQPTFRTFPEISTIEQSLGIFYSLRRRTIYQFIFNELSNFHFQLPGTTSNQIFWWWSLAGCFVRPGGCESKNEQHVPNPTKQLGFQNGEDVNQLAPKFQSLGMKELFMVICL